MALDVAADRQYTAPSAADSVSITPNAGTWANSAYVTLLDPAPGAGVLTGVTVYTTHGSAATTSYDAEVDLAIGAAAAEVVCATVRVYNRRISSGTSTGSTHQLLFPIPLDALPAGSRLSARLRKNNTDITNAWLISVTYWLKPLVTTRLLTTRVITALPPAAVGVTVTTDPTTAWVHGAWAQLRAATGPAVVIIGIVFGGVPMAAEWELDLGTGTAGAETVITSLHVTTATQGFPGVWMLPQPLDAVGANVRLAARLRGATAGTARSMLISLMTQDLPL